MDVLVLETQEEIVAAVKVRHVMKEIVEVALLIPQEYVQRAVEEIVDILVGVIKGGFRSRARQHESWSRLWICQPRKS